MTMNTADFSLFDIAGTLVRDCADRGGEPAVRRERSGLFSQGGAVLILEELEHARRRGATIMAEVTGFAETFDAHS